MIVMIEPLITDEYLGHDNGSRPSRGPLAAGAARRRIQPDLPRLPDASRMVRCCIAGLGGGEMDRGPDRDDNGIPDWQEDENYIDEAPTNAPVGTSGCLIALASLLSGAAMAGLRMRRRGGRAIC
jgi:hypothetical protein